MRSHGSTGAPDAPMYTISQTHSVSGGDAACRDTSRETADGLLSAACSGDHLARQQLYARCLPVLRRWARGRLPTQACDINDTDDLVQIALMRALNKLDRFGDRGYESFLAYLRTILINEVRNELRKFGRRGPVCDCDEALSTGGDPVIDSMLVHEGHRLYTSAFDKLNYRQQEHLAMRLELGMSFREIAAQVGGSVDGARMTVTRALRVMSEHLAAIAA